MPDYQQYPEEYTDEEEYQDNVVDEQREAWEESHYPSASSKESLYSLFNRVWKAKDSTKVANLEKEEIGNLGLSVRDCQNIAWFSNFLGHRGVSRYFAELGEITLATSMSRKGWFTELFVTSKKFAHKGVLKGGLAQQQSKWRLFGKKTEQIEPQV